MRTILTALFLLASLSLGWSPGASAQDTVPPSKVFEFLLKGLKAVRDNAGKPGVQVFALTLSEREDSAAASKIVNKLEEAKVSVGQRPLTFLMSYKTPLPKPKSELFIPLEDSLKKAGIDDYSIWSVFGCVANCTRGNSLDSSEVIALRHELLMKAREELKAKKPN
ncbi:MAG: hypothetical protein V1495_05975 [Pseudomonadota bacterium]